MLVQYVLVSHGRWLPFYILSLTLWLFLTAPLQPVPDGMLASGKRPVDDRQEPRAN